MSEDPRCCELARLVYDCSGPCRRRVLGELESVYAAMRTCEECFEDNPRWPNTFPFQMNLSGCIAPFTAGVPRRISGKRRCSGRVSAFPDMK